MHFGGVQAKSDSPHYPRSTPCPLANPRGTGHGCAMHRFDLPDPLFIDGEALVIDKPAGLPVGTPRRGGQSVDDMLEHLRFGFQRAPVPVHRLDQDTSGCLLLARNPKAMKRFQQAFENRQVTKSYIGVVLGRPEGDNGTIDMPIDKISTKESGWRMVIGERGKPSVTHWRVLAEQDGRSLIWFYPETGRTHQIRVHASEGLGLPLIGDPVYGSIHTAPRLMLHALSIKLERGDKPPVEATAPMPAIFGEIGFVPSMLEGIDG